MPYIPMPRRPEFDSFIDALTAALAGLGYKVGDLNYCITRLLIERRAQSYEEKCATRAACQDAADEYRRRVLDKHEDAAIARNGDIPGYGGAH